jgi:Ca-activated chloride channel family protein
VGHLTAYGNDNFRYLDKSRFLGSVPGVEAGTVKDKGDKYLTQLCERTGGEAFFTGDMLELERAFKKISEELRSQYNITYRPVNQNLDGRERKIEVRLQIAKKPKGTRSGRSPATGPLRII